MEKRNSSVLYGTLIEEGRDIEVDACKILYYEILKRAIHDLKRQHAFKGLRKGRMQELSLLRVSSIAWMIESQEKNGEDRITISDCLCALEFPYGLEKVVFEAFSAYDVSDKDISKAMEFNTKHEVRNRYQTVKDVIRLYERHEKAEGINFYRYVYA